ncbi:ABC transporter ATP-binding protein [Gemmatimonadota bacterium]
MNSVLPPLTGDGNGPVVQIENVWKEFPTAGEPLQVLRGTTLEVAAGEIVTIVGASGSGKSTLLNIIGALDRPTSGTVEVAGRDINSLWDEALAELRNRYMGFVFQFHHLLPEFSARENVALPMLMAGTNREEAMERALELLGSVGLAERADNRPAKLSGGEQQRVAVARALSNNPRLLLADEPSGNLDKVTSESLHELLWDLNSSTGQTLILVTHNQDLAARSPRVLELAEGRLNY